MTPRDAFPVQPETREKPDAVVAVERLMATSRFERSDPKAASTELKMGDAHFLIETIDRGDHPDIPQVQQLLLRQFDETEVDSEEILRQAVEGKTPWGTGDETRYRIHVVKNTKGQIVSIVGGGLLELRNDEDQPTGKMVYMAGYAVTSRVARQRGFAREAYISAIIDAVEIAKARAKNLSFAAGECSYTSENFRNSLGWKRVYAEDYSDEPKSYTELRYVQPASVFTATLENLQKDLGRNLHIS